MIFFGHQQKCKIVYEPSPPQKVALHNKLVQAPEAPKRRAFKPSSLQYWKTKPKQTHPAAEETAPPIRDNNFNIASTSKVATRPSQMGSLQRESSPKPKKQPETQKTNPESLNFHQNKSLNLKKQGKNR